MIKNILALFLGVVLSGCVTYIEPVPYHSSIIYRPYSPSFGYYHSYHYHPSPYYGHSYGHGFDRGFGPPRHGR